ncbi:AMIN-like domain-containing (lipo)protein [Streptomyces natalensis]|uniref:AMIN-like domain-containing protein n=1 Tax=Streptomyces natalensis ATCC 27448 TaxID=1240678 RepID=A0A0D7CLD2_9ACTN|nr:hypothetical protein [Streptomyces natalensis]KIZ16670.1 hypothetical protein SNA_16740 [Streptomyces natalensis ATCC 27448]
MRRWGTAAAALALTAAGLAATAGTADAASGPTGRASSAAACSTAWGSGTKSATGASAAPLKNIRTGRSACYDRMVFDLGGASGKAGYHVGYVDQFQQDGSGEVIPVKGGAILEVFVSASSYDPQTGKQTYAGKAGKPLPGVHLAGYETFRDAEFGASFEGQTQVGLGTRAKLPFRVFQSGNRLVVDVAHHR